MQEIYREILEGLKQAGVTLSASLPDDWVAPLADLLDEDETITSLRVAREPEIVGICSGAFFGGVRAVGVLGATGFLTCISEIATLNLRHHIPALLVVSLRGGLHDFQVFQEVQGRTLLPQLETLGLPHLVLDARPKIALIPRAYQQACLQKRPYVVCLSKALLTEQVSEW
jgi:sulfopyruvate decarboxylase subunit alpha